MHVFVVGNAASGKTTLSLRLKERGFKLVNLDPSTPLPEADFDVRNRLKVEEIAQKYGLGFNGAQIKSMEILSREDFWINEGEDVVYDTPGQMEVFLYHDFGKKMCDSVALRGNEVVLIYIVDAYDVRTLENYVSIIAQAASVYLRLSYPMVVVLNKIDSLSDEEVKNIEEWTNRELLEKVLKNSEEPLAKLMLSLVDFMEYTNIFQRPIMISAKRNEGIEDLMDVLYEIHCTCGDLS